MFVFYFLALIPIVIGGVLWLRNQEIDWPEWVGGSVAALIVAVIFNLIALNGRTGDIETWSGRVTQANYYPRWVEKWIEHHSETYQSGTDSKGNATYSTRYWTTTEYDTHPEHWTVNVDFGLETAEWEISERTFLTIKREFGGKINQGQNQSFNHGGEHYSGDNRSFYSPNVTGFVRPVTKTKSFKNKIKATPTVFSFVKVPTNINVFKWPENPDCWTSQRVLGNATKVIRPYEWDRLNSVLGPTKKVNLIIIGFDSNDSSLGHWQQAQFIGGKKNDIVICYGSDPKKPTWAFTFGWSESELVKKNIDSYIIQNGITTNIYLFLEQEIRENYKIKDWSRFDYIKISPRTVHYVWFLVIMIITQGGLWIWFHFNEFSK